MNLLDWIIVVVSALIPKLWDLIVTKYPSFPLGQNELSELITWLIRLAFGAIVGYKFHKFYLTGVAKGRGITYSQLVKGE